MTIDQLLVIVGVLAIIILGVWAEGASMKRMVRRSNRGRDESFDTADRVTPTSGLKNCTTAREPDSR
jgi:hypothetical protein